VLFTGHYEHVIDAKHRLAIPADIRARWRPEEHGGAWCAVPWVGRVIRLYTEADFARRAQAYAQSLTPDPDQAELQATLFGMTARLEMDAAGRIRLPEELLLLTELGSEVALVGAGDWLEIRDRAQWRQSKKQRLEQMPELMARLERKNADRAAGRGETPSG